MKLLRAFTLTVGALACLLSAGCDNLAPAFRTVPIDRTDRPGDPLTASGTNALTPPVWSADGSRLYVGLYNTLDPNPHWGELHAITIATHTDRVLRDTVPLSSLGASADRAWLYFTADSKLYRVPSAGGVTENVRDSVGYFWWVSADGRGLVYGYPKYSDVWVKTSRSDTALRLPSGTPLAFSPQGDEMLYCRWNWPESGSAAAIVSLETGAVRSAAMVVNDGESWIATRWGDAGIQMLLWRARSHASGYTFEFVVRGTGADTLVLRDSTEGHFGPVRWSPDGTRLAFWKGVCLWVDDLGDCHEHWALYVANLRSGKATWVAGADMRGESPIFSPDSRRIVYQLSDARLYLSDVP